MKYISLSLLALIFCSLNTICSENISVIGHNGYAQQYISILKDNLRYNINQVEQLQQEINLLPLYNDSSDSNDEDNDLEILLNKWREAKNTYETIQKEQRTCRKAYPQIFLSDKSGCVNSCNISTSRSICGKSLISRSESLLNKKIIDYMDIIFITLSGSFGAMIGAGSLGLEDFVFNAKHNQYEDIDLVAPAIIGFGFGASIRIAGMVYRNKKVKDFLRDYPQYLIIKQALNNVELREINLLH